MVKITRPFQFVYPVTKRVGTRGEGWQSSVIIAKGTAVCTSTNIGPTAIEAPMAGFRLRLPDDDVVVHIEIHSVIAQDTGHEVLPELQQEAEFYSALVELCRNFMRKKFLTR